MTGEVVKPSPDEDFYVVWSNVVEAPLAWGTRAEVLDYLEHRTAARLAIHTRELIEQRLDQADQRGTSATWHSIPRAELSWIYDQQGSLPIGRMRAFCQRFNDANPGADDIAIYPDVSDLLDSFDD